MLHRLHFLFIACLIAASNITWASAARLPYPPDEYKPNPYYLSLFLSGELTLQCRQTGNHIRILGECAGGDCMCEPDFSQTRSLMEILNESEWQKLAYTIIYQQEKKTGLHPADFFYVMLGNAAYNLGYKEASLIYYQKARSARYSCLRYGRPDDGRSCGAALRFRQDWLERPLRLIDQELKAQQQEAAREAELAGQAQLEKQRQETAQKARNERAARLKARFPDEWIESIMRGEIQEGFTKEAVREAVGEPRSILVTPSGSEMWIYEDFRVVFTDGKVTYVEHN